jgi:hypothetical protein
MNIGTRAKSFVSAGWEAVKRHGVSFVLDLIVILATASWWTTLFDWFRFYYYPVVVGLLQWKKFYRFPPVRLIFALLSALFASFTVFSLFPMYCVSKPWFVVTASSIPVCFILLVKHGGFSARAFARSFIPALILGVLVVGDANNTCSGKECEAARSKPGLEVLVDLPSLNPPRGLPRYLVSRPDRNDFIVVYRTPSKADLSSASADRFSLKSRTVQPITTIRNEPIGLYYHEPTGRLLIITANKFNHKHPKTMVVLDPRLRVIRILDFPGGEDDDYTAHMMPYGNKVAIQSEIEGLYLFDPVTFALKIIAPATWASKKKCRLFAEPGFLQVSPDKFYISGGIDPLVFELTRASSVCSFDLRKKEYVDTFRSNISGAMDMAYVPDRDEILVTSIWRDAIWVVSARDLKYKRTLHIGPCVRPVGYDPVKKIGYTAECFSGDLVSFDVVTGKILGRRYVGKNSRKIYYMKGLGIVVLSGCGVFRVL